MPQGGALMLAVRADEPRNEVSITFADEGVGMDERARDGYFQPFRSAFEEGTGLGAAIVYRLVEEHGGRIELTSQPGHGTTIRIVVPRVRAGGSDAHEAPLATAGGIPA